MPETTKEPTTEEVYLPCCDICDIIDAAKEIEEGIVNEGPAYREMLRPLYSNETPIDNASGAESIMDRLKAEEDERAARAQALLASGEYNGIPAEFQGDSRLILAMKEAKNASKQTTPEGNISQIVNVAARNATTTGQLQLAVEELERFARLGYRKTKGDTYEGSEIEKLFDSIRDCSIEEKDQVIAQMKNLSGRINHMIGQIPKGVYGAGGGGNPPDQLERSLPEQLSSNNPQCLEDLAEHIMASEVEKWRGDDYGLINKETGRVNKENFLAWIREQIIKYRNNNPDKPIQLFQSIGIVTPWRKISFGDFLTESQYFRSKYENVKFVRNDPDGRPIMKGEPASKKEKRKKRDNKTGQIMYDNNNEVMYEEIDVQDFVEDEEYSNELKMQCLYEVWLFDDSHTSDTGYRLIKGDEQSVPKKLQEIYYYNTFVKDRNRMLRVMKMPRRRGNQFNEFNEDGKQGSVGKAVQKLSLAYFHMAEVESVEVDGNFFLQALGKEKSEIDGRSGEDVFYDSIIRQVLTSDYLKFMKEAFPDFDWKGFSKNPDRTSSIMELINNNKHKFIEEVLRKKTKKRQEENNPGQYRDEPIDGRTIVAFGTGNRRDFALGLLKFARNVDRVQLNLFNDPKKQQGVIDLIHESFKDVVQHTEGLSREEAEYAEAWASSFSYWTGSSARNDTGSRRISVDKDTGEETIEGKATIGGDKWGPVMNTEEYRLGQSEGKGIIGELYTLFGFKRIGLSFWEGVNVQLDGHDTPDKSLLEVLQGGDGSKIDYTKDLPDFEFDGQAQQQFVTNHILNAFTFYNYVLRAHGMNFDKFLRRDQYGRQVFEPTEADKILAEVWKAIRYTFDQQNFNYNAKMRGWHREVKRDPITNKIMRDKNNKVIRELKFSSDKTLRELMFGDELRDMHMYDRAEFSGKDNTQMARNVFAYQVTKELWAHRNSNSIYKLYTMEQVRDIVDYLRNWAYEVEEYDNKSIWGDIKDVAVMKAFFDEHELNSVLKKSRTTFLNMFLELLGISLITGSISGVGEAAKQTANQLVPSMSGGGH